MKKLITFLSTFILFLLIHPAYGSDGPGRTFVFLVHGIGSNTQKTFPGMKEALSQTLPKYSNRQYYFSEFNYETGNDDLNTVDFAESFNQHIGQYLKEKSFDSLKDKISIIAHSQGGIVTLLWLAQSFEGAYATDFHRSVDTFLTLGTPFWGTSIVLFPMWMRLTLAKRFGDQEAREMLWGSQTINYFEKVINSAKGDFKAFLTSINLVNLGGNALVYPNVASWSSYMDDDIAVPLPSSNINHFMVKDQSQFYHPDQVIDVAQKIDIGQFFVVQGLHTFPLMTGKSKFLQGLPQIPKACIKNENCQHITYPYIWRSLLRLPLAQLDKSIAKKTRSYTIDINLKVDQDAMGPDEFEFTFTDMQGKSLKKLGHKMRLIYDRESEAYYQGPEDKRSVRFIFAGKAPNLETQKIMISVRHKGNRFISKKIVSFIRAQQTSFIESPLLRFNDYLAGLE